MPADEQVIRDVLSAWFDATATGDLPRLLTLMADDVVFLGPGRPPYGKAEFAAAFTAGRGQARLACEGAFEEIVVAGEHAYARARLSVTVTPLAGGAPKRLAGYTLSVYRKQADGRWVLARDANLLAPAVQE